MLVVLVNGKKLITHLYYQVLGTGQTVALWEGAGSVTDSETLGNAPITVSGNNTTFAGNVTAGPSITATGDTGDSALTLQANTGNWVFTNVQASRNLEISDSDGTGVAMTIDTSANATFAGTVSSGRITVSSDVAGDSSWDDSGILIENTSTTTGEPTLAFRNAGTNGTGSNYWFTGLNQSSIYKIAYGTSFTDGNTKLELASNGALRLNAYTQGFLQTDANGNISTSGGGTLPGGPYLPLSAGASYPLTSDLYIEGADKALRINNGTQPVVYLGDGGANTDGQLILYSSAGAANVVFSGDTQNHYIANGNVGIGTTTPVETFTVPSSEGAMLGFKRFYSDTGQVPAGVGSGYTLTANLNTEQGTTLTSQYQYKFYLTTTGTGTYNSSVYIVYRNSADTAWDVHRVSSTGLTSNHPELTVSGTSALIYNDHPNAYGVSYRVETSYTGQAKTSPQIFGSDYMWTRDNTDLYYMDGDVGIGVSSPAFKLDVAGAIQTTGSLRITTVNPGVIFKETDITDKNWDIQVNNGNLKFYEVNDARSVFNEHVTFGTGGNVGIGFTSPQAAPLATTKLSVNGNTYVGGTLGVGTTSPDSLLHIKGADPVFIIQDTSTGTANASSTLRLGESGAGGVLDVYWDIKQAADDLNTHLEINHSSNGNHLTILDNGNVGIGTSTPNAKLDVQGTQGQLFSVTDDLSGDIFSVADISGVPIMNVNSDGTSYFDGNVGIGTDSPDNKLFVTASTAGDYAAFIENTNSTNGYGLLARTAQTGTSSYAFAARAGSSDIFVVRGDGNVGIGTASPNTKLHVAGIAQVTESGNSAFYGGNYVRVFGDQNYGFRNTGGTYIANISMSGNSYFNGGNVGIGTTSPGAKLEISQGAGGTAQNVINSGEQAFRFSTKVEDTSTNTAVFRQGIYYNNTENATIAFYRGGSSVGGFMTFQTQNGNERMRIDSVGNVGIGTTSPATKLEVNGGTDAIVTITGTTTAARLDIKTDSYHRFLQTIESDGRFRLYNQTTATEQLTVTNAGNVGIGTASPDDMLEVYGSSPNIRVTNTAETDAGIVFNDAQAGTGQMAAIKFNSSDEKLKFFVNDETSQRMVIDTAGNVGIGPTISPSYLLDVRDGTTSGAIARFSAINAHVVIESSTAGNAVLHLKPNATGSKFGQFKVTAGNGYGFSWSNDAAGTGETTYMDLDTSSTGGGDLTVKGDVIAYGSPSDKKYKENIKPIESALGKAMQLQGVTFDWKDSDSILDIKEDIGFIAQDVQEVLPELVRDSGKGNLSLRYQGITPILLEAIKELKAEIDLLKSKPCNCNNCNCNI